MARLRAAGLPPFCVRQALVVDYDLTDLGQYVYITIMTYEPAFTYIYQSYRYELLTSINQAFPIRQYCCC